MGHESNAPWVQRPKRERARWIAKSEIDQQVQAYWSQPDEFQKLVPMGRWLDLTLAEQDRAESFLKHRDALAKMKMGLEDWMAVPEDQLARRMKQVNRVQNMLDQSRD